MKIGDIENMWKDNIEQLAEYNLWDSQLTLRLSDEIIPQIFSLSKLVGITPFDAARYTYSQLVEAFLMHKAAEQDFLIPNRPKTEQIMDRRQKPIYKGGFVLEPKKGIHSDIIVFDFKSLYPTVIATHNISPDTFNCGCCKVNKVPELKYHFCTKKRGFISRNIEEVIKARLAMKEKLKEAKKGSVEWITLNNNQLALKTLANATYGYLAYVGARWYCYQCAESAAAFGRFYIQKTIDMIMKEGFEVIYGDTDSVFLKIPKVSTKKLIHEAERFLKKINNELPGVIQLEFRGLYEGGIFVTTREKTKGAKKRYALIDYDGNLEIRGFELVRRGWCDVSKNIQHEILKIILKERNPDKATKLVRETIQRIKAGRSNLEELTIYTQLVKPLGEYKAVGPHVRVAQKLQKAGFPIGEGMIVRYIITKGEGKISDRAEPIQLLGKKDYDADYYISHQVLPAAMRVLSALGLTEEEVLSGKKQAKLGKWFEK